MAAAVDGDGLHQAGVVETIYAAVILTRGHGICCRTGEVLLCDHAEGADGRQRPNVVYAQAVGALAMTHRDPLATVRQIEVAPEHVARVLVARSGIATTASATDVSLRLTAITLPPVAPPRIVVHGYLERRLCRLVKQTATGRQVLMEDVWPCRLLLPRAAHHRYEIAFRRARIRDEAYSAGETVRIHGQSRASRWRLPLTLTRRERLSRAVTKGG